MNKPTILIRKSVFFTPDIWHDLQDLMTSLGVETPSLAVTALISIHKNKGTEIVQPNYHSNR